MENNGINIRPLERTDLRFIHEMNNDYSIMDYWFKEPYESYDELEDLYDKHMHDDTERRFVAEDVKNHVIGIVELIGINYVHRNAELQFAISPKNQGQGYARPLVMKALEYSFAILNLHKVYLSVAEDNETTIRLYEDCGFAEEGRMIEEFFLNGKYIDAKRMYILQRDFLK